MKLSPLQRGALRSIVLYCLDLATGITSLIFGFGLQVKNWWVLIGVGLLVRWVWHVSSNAFYYHAAQERVKQEDSHGH